MFNKRITPHLLKESKGERKHTNAFQSVFLLMCGFYSQKMKTKTRNPKNPNMKRASNKVRETESKRKKIEKEEL